MLKSAQNLIPKDYVTMHSQFCHSKVHGIASLFVRKSLTQNCVTNTNVNDSADMAPYPCHSSLVSDLFFKFK